MIVPVERRKFPVMWSLFFRMIRISYVDVASGVPLGHAPVIVIAVAVFDDIKAGVVDAPDPVNILI
jgi:hypothetical protein